METVNKTNKQNVKYQTKKAEILKAIQNFENKRPSRIIQVGDLVKVTTYTICTSTGQLHLPKVRNVKVHLVMEMPSHTTPFKGCGEPHPIEPHTLYLTQVWCDILNRHYQEVLSVPKVPELNGTPWKNHGFSKSNRWLGFNQDIEFISKT